MKAMHLVNRAGKLILEATTRPIPKINKPTDVIIKIKAAGVIPTELIWCPTLYTRSGGTRLNPIPSHEFSGIVASSHPSSGFKEGDEVYGLTEWFEDGTMAEYCSTLSSSICKKPSSLSHSLAATIPVSALTAWQGLFEQLKLKKNETILIHGGAGSVGAFAVQLAHQHGAHVIATISPHNNDLVMSLGADDVIDYKSISFEQAKQNVDVVFDTVGGDTLKRSWSVLKKGGRLVTCAASEQTTMHSRGSPAFFIVAIKGDQLEEITKLFEDGKLKTFVKAEVPFEKAPEAYAGTLPNTLPYGKVVIKM